MKFLKRMLEAFIDLAAGGGILYAGMYIGYGLYRCLQGAGAVFESAVTTLWSFTF